MTTRARSKTGGAKKTRRVAGRKSLEATKKASRDAGQRLRREPTLEELAREWLAQNQEAMKRLAEL